MKTQKDDLKAEVKELESKRLLDVKSLLINIR